jgi:Protein involved in cell division
VLYVNSEDINRAIEYDLNQEKNFSYKGLSAEETIEHIAKFVSNLWQIHPFGEGNTRTIAVFTIKYLRSIGFNVNNDLFANHSWYFRNALVRANYRNVRKSIEPDMNYLISFFKNLIMNEDSELKNRYLIINPPLELMEEPELTSTLQAHPTFN